ncbi:MAG TPA: hypothetical protein VFD03_05875 [Clostridia bacterium]|nr:hypothetical protein [Clostridia bacterium]
MPKLTIDEREIIKRKTIDRELKKDEMIKGRLALGVGFLTGFDNKTEVIEVIRRKK